MTPVNVLCSGNYGVVHGAAVVNQEKQGTGSIELMVNLSSRNILLVIMNGLKFVESFKVIFLTKNLPGNLIILNDHSQLALSLPDHDFSDKVGIIEEWPEIKFLTLREGPLVTVLTENFNPLWIEIVDIKVTKPSMALALQSVTLRFRS